MPTTFTIQASLEVPIGAGIGFKDVHRLVCFLMEDEGVEAHEQQTKPFTAWPLLLDSDDDRQIEIKIHSLVDDPLVEDQIRTRLHGFNGKKPNLGKSRPLSNADVSVEYTAWESMSLLPPKSSVDVELLSPMFYSRSGNAYPLPDPVLVHRQLALRWNEFVPENQFAIDDDMSRELNSLVRINDFDISSVTLHEVNRKVAAVGQFSFRLTKNAETIHQEWFASLWTFAEFCGLGALTAQGLGAVSVHLR